MKYILIVLVVIASSSVGKIISDKYKNRVKFYNLLIKFADFLILNIYELQENIVLIFDKFINELQVGYKNDFLKIKNMIVDNSLNCDSLLKLKLFNEISRNEIEDINNFFYLLGKNNFESQISLIKNYKHIFEVRLEECNISQKQKGNISYKLSLCVGVMIAILIM